MSEAVNWDEAFNPTAPAESASTRPVSRTWPIDEPRETLDWETGRKRTREWCTHSGCARPEEYGQRVCTIHGARIPTPTSEHLYQQQFQQLRARQVVTEAAPAAAGHLITIMATAQKESDQLRAAEQILDRAGIRGGTEITLQGDVRVSPAEEVRARLEKIAERLAPAAPAALDAGSGPEADDPCGVVDAEVVPEETSNNSPRSPW